MSRVRSFFLEEATGCLETARAELGREVPDRTTVYRAVRRLRGSAQLARFGGVAREAGALEVLLCPEPGEKEWSPALDAAARPGLGRLETAIEGIRAGEIEPMAETESVMEGEARVEEGEVGMEELEYRGPAALERALELREAMDEVVSDPPMGALLDELFDLIRLGMR